MVCRSLFYYFRGVGGVQTLMEKSIIYVSFLNPSFKERIRKKVKHKKKI